MDPAVVAVGISNNAHGYRKSKYDTVGDDPGVRRRAEPQLRSDPKGDGLAKNASPNASYRQETSKCSSEVRAGSRTGARLPLRAASPANLRLSMSSSGAPVSLTLGRQPTASCYIIGLLPTADGPVLEVFFFFPAAQTPTFQRRSVGARCPAFDRRRRSSL